AVKASSSCVSRAAEPGWGPSVGLAAALALVGLAFLLDESLRWAHQNITQFREWSSQDWLVAEGYALHTALWPAVGLSVLRARPPRWYFSETCLGLASTIPGWLCACITAGLAALEGKRLLHLGPPPAVQAPPSRDARASPGLLPSNLLNLNVNAALAIVSPP